MTNHSRQYSTLDQFIMSLDQTIATVFGQPVSQRPNPAEHLPETSLTTEQQRDIAGLMRINHAGEICAQALYQGQAMTARLPNVRQKMEQAAREEVDHLHWCEQRIKELRSHTSYLNPLWYAGSFAIGAVAGWLGDKISLGFVAETERQVTEHLDQHLMRLPTSDQKSRAILQQMRTDENQHAVMAHHAGAASLPVPIQIAMRFTSKVMTLTAYWV